MQVQSDGICMASSRRMANRRVKPLTFAILLYFGNHSGMALLVPLFITLLISVHNDANHGALTYMEHHCTIKLVRSIKFMYNYKIQRWVFLISLSLSQFVETSPALVLCGRWAVHSALPLPSNGPVFAPYALWAVQAVLEACSRHSCCSAIYRQLQQCMCEDTLHV